VRNLYITLLVAALALTTALASAQEHENAPVPHNTGHAPTTHVPTTGAPAEPGHGDKDTHGAQSGAHRSGDHQSEPAGAHVESAGHDVGHHGPEAINWTDIFDTKKPAVAALVINFAILMTLYYMLGKKPITEALKQRRVTIGKDIDEAQKLLDEAKERAKKYQAELSTADADAATAKASLISAGKGEVDRILLEAKERADRMKRDADRLVEQERKQVHQDLLKETVELAVQQATVLLEKTVTADDHARLAQDLLAELSRRPSAKKVPPAAGSVRPPSLGGGSGGGVS
jgi:F-type H+-transporting ATPase subunit b